MLPAQALEDYKQLPNEAQQQVLEFIEFMKFKYQPNPRRPAANVPLSKGAFGSIHVTRSVSLEEMEDAIAQQGSRL